MSARRTELTVHGLPIAAEVRAGDDLAALIGVALRAGGLVLRPPLAGPLVAVTVDGVPASDFATDDVVVRHCPATVVMRNREA